jgi:hypothetical protein
VKRYLDLEGAWHRRPTLADLLLSPCPLREKETQFQETEAFPNRNLGTRTGKGANSHPERKRESGSDRGIPERHLKAFMRESEPHGRFSTYARDDGVG